MEKKCGSCPASTIVAFARCKLLSPNSCAPFLDAGDFATDSTASMLPAAKNQKKNNFSASMNVGAHNFHATFQIQS
jgi:hypothetical protein